MYQEYEILITGSNGLVGLELKKLYPNAFHITREECDLTNETDIIRMFDSYTPKVVIHLAAKVGGILDNIDKPAEYFDDNIIMNTLLIKHAKENKVERFIGILSSCIFPDVMENYPLSEDDLHAGPPPLTNFSYSYAKRCMAVQINAYNQQYDTKYNYLIPCNMYGENDKIDIQNSHFITALLVKIKNAELNGDDSITLFGDGTPLRQFMHSKDLANIIKIIIDNEIYDNLNIATNENLTIHEMAMIALKATNNEHLKIKYDNTKPNGQFRKDISTKKLHDIIPSYEFVNLFDGIKSVYKTF